MLTAQTLLSKAPLHRDGGVVLSYDERLLRRKRLVSAEGISFLVDLPSVTNLDDFWGFELSDGRAIEVVPAAEELVEVRGENLLRYAWHIGNRHTPCQIAPDRLLIRVDHVLEAMLHRLGAELTRVHEPFRPEGGAYGHGRTMGHSHGADGHSHGDTSHSHGAGGESRHAPDHGHHAADHRDAHAGQQATDVLAAKPLALKPFAAESAAQQAANSAQASKPHQHGAGCGCGGHEAAAEPAPYQSWQPEAEPAFGWHHHGDGKMHYHAPRQPLPDDPISKVLGQTLAPKGK